VALLALHRAIGWRSSARRLQHQGG
jgi:hypothetical protein